MRHLALFAALLLPSATAQSIPAIPAAPAPAGTPAPANATPVNTAPVNPAPVNPVPTPLVPADAAPAQPVPSQPAPTAPVLLLSAAVGMVSELASTSSTRMTLDDVEVTAAPGARVSETKLKEARRAMTTAMSDMKNMPTMTTTGKTFYKVSGRDASGLTTLVISSVLTVPGSAGKAAKPTTVTVTQQVAPDGKATVKSYESSDPQVSALLKGLTPEKLQQMSTQGGTDAAGMYGRPLVVGTPSSTTFTLDASELLSSFLGSFGGAEMQKMTRDVQATPLQATVTTAYRGQDAGGQHTFDIQSTYNPWQVDLKLAASGAAPTTMKLSLLSGQSKGSATYRADGLPSGVNQANTMKMQLIMVMDNIQVKMLMTTTQTTTLKPR